MSITVEREATIAAAGWTWLRPDPDAVPALDPPTRGRPPAPTVEVIRADPGLRGLSATPPEVLVGTLPHPYLRLRGPIRVEVQRDGDAVGVWSPDLQELGVGPHLSAAVEDFQRSVVELYLALEADQQRLGPDLAGVWRRLQDLVVARP